MSIADLVKKFDNIYVSGGGGGDINAHVHGGELAFYTNPLSINGEDITTEVKISVSSNDISMNNKNTKPFKSYLYTVLDSIVI
jgi:hypothetical protein